MSDINIDVNLIEIKIDADKGYICIADNGCGINSRIFESTLRDIANSGKSSADNKGFRGIGRLCGLG